MAAGVPVVASRKGALPETCGDAAAYVELEPEAVAAALETLGADEAARARLVAAGTARATAATPAAMAARTMEVYRKVLA